MSPLTFEILIHISSISKSSFHQSTVAYTGAGELQFLQHGRRHGRPWCGHQLGPVRSIVADVAGCAAQISAPTMLIVPKCSGKLFSTCITHCSDGASCSFSHWFVFHRENYEYPADLEINSPHALRKWLHKWQWPWRKRNHRSDLKSHHLCLNLRNFT